MADWRYGTSEWQQYPVTGPPPEWPPRVEVPRTMPTPQPRHAAPASPYEPPRRRTLRGFFRRPDADRRHWLLLIPIVLPLVPTLYNRIEPAFLGLPFFYWCQLGFAFLASGVIAYVHTRVR